MEYGGLSREIFDGSLKEGVCGLCPPSKERSCSSKERFGGDDDVEGAIENNCWKSLKLKGLLSRQKLKVIPKPRPQPNIKK